MISLEFHSPSKKLQKQVDPRIILVKAMPPYLTFFQIIRCNTSNLHGSENFKLIKELRKRQTPVQMGTELASNNSSFCAYAQWLLKVLEVSSSTESGARKTRNIKISSKNTYKRFVEHVAGTMM